jgi:hypothetical protein
MLLTTNSAVRGACVSVVGWGYVCRECGSNVSWFWEVGVAWVWDRCVCNAVRVRCVQKDTDIPLDPRHRTISPKSKPYSIRQCDMGM